jgi:hypothetical protein
MSLEVNRKRTTLMREIALRMPRLLHLSLLKPSHIVCTAISLKISRGFSFYSYLELSCFMYSGYIPETEWSYGNCSPPTFGVWIHWHNCCMKFLLEGENEELLTIHFPINNWVHDLQCLTLLCDGEGSRGGGKLKKESSSPKNWLLLMSRGRSYHTRTIIWKELSGCTLIFRSPIFNSSRCNCQLSQIVVSKTCGNACPAHPLLEWKMMILIEVPLYVQKQFCN